MVAAIACRDLTKAYSDVRAVDRLSLTVDAGTTYGLLGLNGAGKTTTIGMLTGVLPKTGGRVRIADLDPFARRREVARRVGIVFSDNVSPEPAWSPVRYLRHFGALFGIDRETSNERIAVLLRLLHLERDAERPLARLSGGNRRKVELARAFLHEPAMMFLDEPTRELDLVAKREIWDFLNRLVREGSVTVFLSSHDAHEIATLCGRIGVLRGGRLTWEGTPSELGTDVASMADALTRLLQGLDAAISPA